MYNKTVWKTGDIIPADKMNNIENGIGANDIAITDIKKELVKTVKTSEKGQPNGVAILDEHGKIPADNMPANTPTLGEDGKIPQEQLPELDFIPESEKGQPDGVAPLNKDGVLEIKYGGTDANDSQNALYNLGCGVRKNYFDNPDFKINQEKAEYNIPISMGKIVDRWYSEGIGNCEYTENGIITNNQYVRQMWSSSTITAGKWTVSALCTGDIAVVFGKYGYGDIKVDASSTNYDNGLASVTFDIPQSLLNQISYNDYIYIMCKSGLGTNKGLLKYVKFEKGETQTLARKLEDGSWELLEKPDYVAELAKCQIYFKRLPAYYLLGGAVQNNAVFQYSLNPPMRIAPTITIERETDLTNAIDDGTHIITPTKLTKMRADKESIYFYYTFEQGENKTSTFYNLRYVDVSAEL